MNICYWFSIMGVVLKCFKSYLQHCTRSESVRVILSDLANLSYGITQCSVLGLLLLTLCTVLVSSLLPQYNIWYYFYGNDTQIFVNFVKTLPSNCLQSLSCMLELVQPWMTDKKFLTSTAGNTKDSILSFHSLLENLAVVYESMRNLGIVFDSNLSFD